MPRETTEACTVRGYEVPASQDAVIVNAMAIVGTDPRRVGVRRGAVRAGAVRGRRRRGPWRPHAVHDGGFLKKKRRRQLRARAVREWAGRNNAL